MFYPKMFIVGKNRAETGIVLRQGGILDTFSLLVVFKWNVLFVFQDYFHGLLLVRPEKLEFPKPKGKHHLALTHCASIQNVRSFAGVELSNGV